MKSRLTDDAARGAFGAALTLQMRDPLAGAELAATQLAREATTPRQRELAEHVSLAVGELDSIISRLLGVLLPTPGDPSEPESLVPVVEDVCRRFAPVLAARGIDWDSASDAVVDVRGDSEQARRLTVGMLRVGASLAGFGGRLSVELRQEEGALGYALSCQRGEMIAGGEVYDDSRAEEAIEEARALALCHGGSLAVQHEAAGSLATLWIPESEIPCGAS